MRFFSTVPVAVTPAKAGVQFFTRGWITASPVFTGVPAGMTDTKRNCDGHYMHTDRSADTAGSLTPDFHVLAIQDCEIRLPSDMKN